MANKVFAIITDFGREQALEVGLVYPMNWQKDLGLAYLIQKNPLFRF